MPIPTAAANVRLFLKKINQVRVLSLSILPNRARPDQVTYRADKGVFCLGFETENPCSRKKSNLCSFVIG